MKTQLELAREGIVTEQMKAVAGNEVLCAETIRERVAKGEIVIANNPRRPDQKVTGIGGRWRHRADRHGRPRQTRLAGLPGR